MFNRTITLTSTDGSVNLSITAGSEGLKSLLISGEAGSTPKEVTPQALIDIVAPALRGWIASQ